VNAVELRRVATVRFNKMDEVYHAKPLSMAFCLDCHRDPAAKLRPPDKITDLNWKWSDDR